ncbi:epoxide hydrolase family protein [Rhizorhabdus dicambivorans]|uniref:Epoxide hydrolase n=1 Tax=Rhizorhabdus dicambivorans TaxID=1850238 RepID=A0A2A4FZ10_9SPHN|nr:epoxide hydrolase family protein [Rhizorhabdus dicambivorans]ATE65872.1 epoxide hydrolase [Rhizorhabdus dicambivorans]PCE42986.1 epoxide hydrolase [Rhizorhabdus dicambivorans]
MREAEAITPFRISISEAALDDLRERLARTRWPESETVDGWTQGAPLEQVRALCDYWRTGYDWRRCEAQLNGYDQFRTVIDGLGIHFLHIRSPEPDALPLIMTHGWPGSVIEFLKVIGPLTDPVAHGGRPDQAFHLVLPSLPGYGFSDRPDRAGWTVERIAAAWIELMRRLGYDRYVAQGGDWGAGVTAVIGRLAPPACAAIHLNVALTEPTGALLENLTPAEEAAIADRDAFYHRGSGYAAIQGTRPQTIGYALADSPAAQAAWIYEKFQAWTDCNGAPETILTRDEMLDDISLYWLTGTGASSARLYWESMTTAFVPQPIAMPIGISIFPRELFRSSRRWADALYPNIIHWNELPRGGHFAAFEQPGLFVDELRACFLSIR